MKWFPLVTALLLLHCACKPGDDWVFDGLKEVQREANRLSGDFDIDGAERHDGPPPQMAPGAEPSVRLEGLAAPFQSVESEPFEFVLRFAPDDATRVAHLALWVERATIHLRIPLTVDPTTGIASIPVTLRPRSDRSIQFDLVLVVLDADGHPARSFRYPLWITAFGADGPNRMRVHLSDPSAVSAVGFLPRTDGFAVLSAGDAGRITSWQFEETSVRLSLTGHTARVLALVATPDGARIVSGSQDHSVRLWDAQTGAELANRREHTDFVEAVVAHPGGAMLASGSWDGTVIVRDPVDATPVRTLQAGDRVNDLAFSPDGTLLAAGLGLLAHDGSVRIWDTISWAETDLSTGLSGEVRAVAFSSDGRVLAAAYGRGAVGAWDLASGNRVVEIVERSDTISDIAFHPSDPELLAGVTLGGLFTVWDLDEGSIMMAMGTGPAARTLAISPDASVLAFGDMEGATRAYALPLSEIMGF